MKRLFFWLVMFLIPFATARASTGPHLVITLTSASPAKSDDGMVRVTIANDGNAPAYVLKTSMPSSTQGRLLSDVFKVADAAGERAQYLGQGVAMAASVDSYVEIAPDTRSTFDVNIPGNYRIRSGLTTITFESIQYERKPLATEEGNILHTEASAPLTVWLTSNAVSMALLRDTSRVALAASAITACPEGFSTGELIATAKAMEESAWATIAATSTIEDGEYIIHNPDARWKKWFGSTQSTGGPETSLSLGNARATGRVYSIHYGLSTQLGLGQPPQIQCDDCHDQPTGVVAHVQYPNISAIDLGNYAGVSVLLCPAAFNLPSGGSSSLASTVLHEMSHVPILTDEGIIGGTTDNGGPATSTALELARTNADAAADSAYNTEFWFKNP